MNNKPKTVEFRNKDVVLFKDIMKQTIDQYIELMAQEWNLPTDEIALEALDTNALASVVAQTVFGNLGIAAEATTAWFKWKKESGQIG